MDGIDPFVPFISTGGTMRTAIEFALDTMGACHITTGEMKCYSALRSGGSTFLFDSHACTGTVEPSTGGATDAAALFTFTTVRDLVRFLLVRGYGRDSRSYEVAPIRAVCLEAVPDSDDLVADRNPRDSGTQTATAPAPVVEPASEAAVEAELPPKAAAADVPGAETQVPDVEVEVATAEAEATETETEETEVETNGAEVAAEVADVDAEVATAMAEVADADAEVATAMAEVAEAETDVAKAETEVPDVEAEVHETEAEVATVKAAASEAEVECPEAEAEVAKVAPKKAPWYRRLFRCLSCVRGEKD